MPAEGTAILFGRSIAARIPDDLPGELAMAVMDVCGAPALTARVVSAYPPGARVAVIGGAGKSGSMSLAAARRAGARTVGHRAGRARGRAAARGRPGRRGRPRRRPRPGRAWPPRSSGALGAPADVTVVCVDVPGCEHGAMLVTAEGGTVIFFSMATSFSAAALGAEGLAADVTMLIGNGYVPGHADYAWTCCAPTPQSARLFERRLSHDHEGSDRL